MINCSLWVSQHPRLAWTLMFPLSGLVLQSGPSISSSKASNLSGSAANVMWMLSNWPDASVVWLWNEHREWLRQSQLVQRSQVGRLEPQMSEQYRLEQLTTYLEPQMSEQYGKLSPEGLQADASAAYVSRQNIATEQWLLSDYMKCYSTTESGIWMEWKRTEWSGEMNEENEWREWWYHIIQHLLRQLELVPIMLKKVLYILNHVNPVPAQNRKYHRSHSACTEPYQLLGILLL